MTGALPFFFLLHRRHPLLLPMPSPRAIVGILDAATTPALSLSSLAVNLVVFSLNATSSPFSLLCFFSTNPPDLASTVPPFLISSPTTQEGLCSPTTMAVVSRRSSSSPSLSVFLPPSSPPPCSLPSPHRRPWLFTVAAPPSTSSSLFAYDHTIAPFSAFFCVFSTSVAMVAAVRRLPFPLLHRRCLLFCLPTPPPPCLFFPPLAFFLFLCTTGDFVVHRCYRRSCYRPPMPLLSLFFCLLLPSLPPTATSVVDAIAIPHRLPLSSCPAATISILRRHPPPTTLTSTPPNLLRQHRRRPCSHRR